MPPVCEMIAEAMSRARHLLHLVAVEDVDAEIVRRVGADADLDGTVRVDNAGPRRARHEGAVVDALAVVEPGILMRVELHERQRAVLGRMRLEQRPGDVVIAAERQQEGADCRGWPSPACSIVAGVSWWLP